MPSDVPARGSTAAPDRRHRQNASGDIVIPLDRGEIVALPRLWDFGLASADRDGCVLVASGGLVATVAFADGTAVVESVAEGGRVRPAGVR